MDRCLSCELPVKPDEQQPNCRKGVVYHKICFSLVVANLEAEMEVFCRDNPDWLNEEGLTVKGVVEGK